MKKAAILMTILTLIFSGCAIVATVDDPAPARSSSSGKVAVCHKGKKTIYVDEAAVKAHLKHGDYPGVCR